MILSPVYNPFTFLSESSFTSSDIYRPKTFLKCIRARECKSTLQVSGLISTTVVSSLGGSKMAAKGITVDLNKPLVFQVGQLGDDYEEWINKPILSKEGPRFFANPILEFSTRTAWWVVPLVWLPVATWFVLGSVKMGLTPTELAATFLTGFCGWTLMEYTLHRFFFHKKLKGYWGNTLHYLLHGCHHKHPMDSLRLVFPPAGAAILASIFWNLLFKPFIPPSIAPALFGGFLVGYVAYDLTHYYLHHGKPMKGVSHKLRRNHMDHHFRNHDSGYGITSNFWDKVFGTLPPERS